MSEAISAAIENIRAYTYAPEHQELSHATIWSFDVLLLGSTLRPEVAVFGINQAEYHPADETLRRIEGRILEDSSLGTFRDTQISDPQNKREAKEVSKAKADKWYRTVRSFIGTDLCAILGEFFFWSSKNAKSDFETRYGTRFEKSPHLGFCRDQNLILLREYEPKLVVISGSEANRCARLAELYDLDPIVSDSDLRMGAYCARFYKERATGRLWIFSPHFSNGHGISTEDRKRFRERVERELKRG